ncbi:hypothetical protein SM124_16235 [Bacillus sp. 31A1R]|uniref:Uncharacterized protein n=1 Tax=Robertmurraya mangrovi TaxID=3098077 RepID=A0ABU5J1M3_9BACI|nr:hypothetical protein [Bacillus sp. 31A1R]MDZ5473267.1 hypothetical protein [Bacillus sp. 31A1R]
MKYYILYLINKNGLVTELYLKGKSMSSITEKINNNPYGLIITRDCSIVTKHIEIGFFREVDPNGYPYISSHKYLLN